MKHLLIFLASLAFSPAFTYAQHVNTNALVKGIEDAKRKHRAEQAQQQQQQVTQQKVQQTVNQTQQAATQMANTNYTQDLRQTSSVRPTNANGARTLSKVDTKSMFGGANGNITTSIGGTPENESSTPQETSDSTTTNQPFNQQGGAGFNMEGNSYTPTYKNAKKFTNGTQSEIQRIQRSPTSNPNTPKKPVSKPSDDNINPVPPIGPTESDRQKAYDKIEKNIPDKYLGVGQVGDIMQASATLNYLTWRAQDAAMPGYVSYCVKHIVDRDYMVVRGEMIKGQCKYTPISKPRQNPIQTIVKGKTSQSGKGTKQNKAPKNTPAMKPTKPSKKP